MDGAFRQPGKVELALTPPGRGLLNDMGMK